MKKFIKCLSVFCLALILLCPVALVGCDKNYTITVSIASGSENFGYVYKKGSNSEQVLGKNAVDKGDKFEYYITPKTGYEISKILIDGSEYTEAYTKSGAYLYFEEIDKNHTVVISFAAVKCTIDFYCKNSGSIGYHKYSGLSSVEINYNSNLDLNADIYGGQGNKLWFTNVQLPNGSYKVTYMYNGSSDITDDIVAGYVSNNLKPRSNIILYCNLTESELEQVLAN